MSGHPQPDAALDLSRRSPREGDTLVYDGLDWEVTDYSAYKDESGYRVKEWCCETEDTEAYLLRESTGPGEPRWFFTRWIESSRVSFPKGAAIPRWDGSRPAPQAPETLTCDGETFVYADATDGVYEDEPGKKQDKVTWDYWDQGRRRNVAIELWDDGDSDCYLGTYILASEIAIRGAAPGRSSDDGGWEAPNRPFKALGYAAVLLFCLALFSCPIDLALTIALPVGALGALQAAPYLPASLYATAALCAAVLGWLFGLYPPLSHPVGMAAAVAAPFVVAAVAAQRDERQREHVRYLAAVAAALPAFLWGARHYFVHAPEHTLGNYLRALQPAFWCALAAYAVVSLKLSARAEPAP